MQSPHSVSGTEPADTSSGSAWQVFLTFLKLGFTSFGGPVAHIGYFRTELVEKQRWLSDSQFAQLLAICQFLPGPASSQMGFSLGLMRAGWRGAFAAFLAFTAPSVVLMMLFAFCLPYFSGEAGAAVIHGLKIVALAVVAQGVLGMSRQLCPDKTRAGMALLAAAVVLIVGTAWVQLLLVMLGALAGIMLCREVKPEPAAALQVPYGSGLGVACLAAFALLFIGLPLLSSGEGIIAAMQGFYQAGALVFGGGHVVLPMLEDAVVAPGWVSSEDFLAGYGAAQALPGPMFSFAAYLGSVLPDGMGGIGGALLAVLSIFLPGFLLLAGCLPLWKKVSQGASAARGIAGVNAVVVGLLGAALFDPIFVSAVTEPADLAIGIVGFLMLVIWRLSPLWTVLWCVAASLTLALA
ncbi:chromate efflux transporter [Aliamphritea hakodatensis]|uniref:chromate efflux transporter n=1 Tax=Aliamphritea hakodatensis TaxID=2895352 RepID=UPI0022FD6948|nr:chromate efflux transporter [Aliamphritea hakodatensis]